MFAVLSVLIVLVVSMIVVRVAAIALMLTGVSEPLARFQARSAFTGAGFTTSESEQVVQHPVRRRIIMWLMLMGNAGIVTVVSSLILSIIGAREQTGLTGSIWFRMGLLLAGLVVLWIAASSEWLNRQVSKLILWSLRRWTDLEVRDYAGLLHLTGEYVVAEMKVRPEDWMCDKSLIELKLTDEGVLVLGVEKGDGKYLGAPRGKAVLHAGDTIILYGRREILADLDRRRAGAVGNWRHVMSVEKQKRVELEEAAEASGDGQSVET